MKLLTGCLLGLLVACTLSAQQTPSPQTSQPAAQKSISSQLGLHAFPAKDQSREQQQTDELTCYNWAQQDAGFDPLVALKSAQSAQVSQSPNGAPQGAGAKGAARS